MITRYVCTVTFRIQLMIKKVQINNIPVWFYISELMQHVQGNREELAPCNEFICYFRFSEPTTLINGELIRDELKRPKIFQSQEEALVFGMGYVKQQFIL